MIIAPSILSADYANFADGVKMINASGAGYVHIDIMDGVFVPPISFGQETVAALRPLSSLVFDVHLMTVNPGHHIESFAKAGADSITFHLEACPDAAEIKGIIDSIHSLDKKAGVSIKPLSPVSLLEPYLSLIDLVLIMTVEPGYGGQKLIPECLDKVRELVEIRKKLGLSFPIEIDGGVNLETAPLAKKAGVDILVTGSSFFNAPNKKTFVEAIS
jgi:ribulose-phosphate 3-epimerase